MSRAEFERLATPLVDRAFDVCREALGLAHVDIGEIDHVLLVGGCTRIPCVRRRVEEYFRRELDAHLDPHEVVALGASLQAYALSAARTSAGRIEVPPAPLSKASPIEAKISSDWRQKTQPFGRLGSTNIGMGQTRDPGTADSIQVPAPEGVPSRPAPTTQNLVSRGRLNTAVGIGPSSRADDASKHLHGATGKVHPAFNDSLDESDDGSDFEPEDLLPVVAATGRGARAAPMGAPNSLAEPDDDEATTVRVFLDPAQDPESNLPLVKPESLSSANEASTQGDDDTVRFQKAMADLPELQPPIAVLPGKSVQALQELHSGLGLPAVGPSGTNISSKIKSSAAPPEFPATRSTKAPSTDELRQRYGDLPLIIGGKRLGTRASENPEQLPELPELRPPLNTVVDSSTVPPPSDEALPALRIPKAPQPTTPDLSIHAELPLVGVGATEKHNLGSRSPILSRPHNPVPARLPAKIAPSPANAGSSTGDVPISLNDNDLVEEPRSQPPSTARISVRPAMRSEPIAEAALPVPNLPEWDIADRPASFESQRPPVPKAIQNKTPAASYPASRRRVGEGIDSARPVESMQTGPLASGVNLSPATAAIEAPRLNPPVQASARPASSISARNEDRRQHQESSRLAPLIAGGPLANLPARDMGPGYATASLPQQHYGVGVPLLIDVTPLSLCVETVGSYSDVLIDRNTPVPCERSREFVTVQDGQQVVRVRVAQGESRVFSENLPLGELELTGLRPAPRGQMRISVTFGLDSDGILHVRAIDLDTGRATTSELRLAGIPSSSEVAHMASRHLATS
jgi:molecular chaperone DnaK